MEARHGDGKEFAAELGTRYVLHVFGSLAMKKSAAQRSNWPVMDVARENR